MWLPGGVWDGTRRQREFAFGPVTGALELAILEQAASDESLPRRITAVLADALAGVGGHAPTTERVHGLAVGDRQFLMRQFARALGRDTVWLAPECTACGARFDVRIEQSGLPVKPAAPSFPHTFADTSWGRCRLRVPTGADQEAVLSIQDDAAAVRALARRCILTPAPAGEIDDADVALIERAVEAVAPEVATLAETECPECHHANRVEIDPYQCLADDGGTLWDDVHQLATAYHWSEREILGLSRARRETYLLRIARASGTPHATSRSGSGHGWW